MHRRRLTGALLAVAATAGPTACSGPGTVDASPALHATSSACTKVSALWPTTVSQKKARSTSAKSGTVRAWGDPAIIARCGVDSPGPTTDQCLDVNGIDWVAHPLDDGYRFITFGRSPAIEVLIPTRYGSFGLAAFTAAAGAIPQGSHVCTTAPAAPGPAGSAQSDATTEG